MLALQWLHVGPKMLICLILNNKNNTTFVIIKYTFQNDLSVVRTINSFYVDKDKAH